MKYHGDFEPRMWRVLEKENLANLAQYHRPGFFDEVPLYPRFADVSFLSRLNRDQADGFLLSFGIKFLKALIWYEIPRQPFVASLTSPVGVRNETHSFFGAPGDGTALRPVVSSCRSNRWKSARSRTASKASPCKNLASLKPGTALLSSSMARSA
jgi:hypothetical protein